MTMKDIYHLGLMLITFNCFCYVSNFLIKKLFDFIEYIQKKPKVNGEVYPFQLEEREKNDRLHNISNLVFWNLIVIIIWFMSTMKLSPSYSIIMTLIYISYYVLGRVEGEKKANIDHFYDNKREIFYKTATDEEMKNMKYNKKEE